MAQGAIKKKASTGVKQAVAKRQNKKTSIQQSKSIKPKKNSARKFADISRKHAAALTALTETSLSSKAGHLDVLKKEAELKKAKEEEKRRKRS